MTNRTGRTRGAVAGGDCGAVAAANTMLTGRDRPLEVTTDLAAPLRLPPVRALAGVR